MGKRGDNLETPGFFARKVRGHTIDILAMLAEFISTYLSIQSEDEYGAHLIETRWVLQLSRWHYLAVIQILLSLSEEKNTLLNTEILCTYGTCNLQPQVSG